MPASTPHRLCAAMRRGGFALAIACALAGCGSMGLGVRFPINPSTDIKIGHDRVADVVRKMGTPYRRFTDAKGREILTYVWADGKGSGQKCVVAFNEAGLAYVVEVAP